MNNLNLRAVKKTVVITHAGRSGSFLLHNLIDGHPAVLSHPPETLTNLELHIYSIFEKYRKHLIKSKNEPDQHHQSIQLSNVGLRLSESNYGTFTKDLVSYMPNIFKEWNTLPDAPPAHFKYIDSSSAIGVEMKRFISAVMVLLRHHFENYDILLPSDLFALVFYSYFIASGKGEISDTPILVWQKHGGVYGNIDDIIIDPVSITTIRRPEDALDSWVAAYMDRWSDPSIARKHYSESFDSIPECYAQCVRSTVAGLLPKPWANSQYAIRFEDMHRHTESLMKKVCEIIGIQWHPILLETTLDGKRVGFIHWYGGDIKKVTTGLNKNIEPTTTFKFIGLQDIWQLQAFFGRFFSKFHYTKFVTGNGFSKENCLFNLGQLKDELYLMKTVVLPALIDTENRKTEFHLAG